VSDNRGSADYKRHLADELTRRTLRTAVDRIQAGIAGDDATRGGNS
jgi:carbon-monoxide dehydrogenase medium subunit